MDQRGRELWNEVPSNRCISKRKSQNQDSAPAKRRRHATSCSAATRGQQIIDISKLSFAAFSMGLHSGHSWEVEAAAILPWWQEFLGIIWLHGLHGSSQCSEPEASHYWHGLTWYTSTTKTSVLPSSPFHRHQLTWHTSFDSSSYTLLLRESAVKSLCGDGHLLTEQTNSQSR